MKNSKIKILSIDDSKAVHAFIDRSLLGTQFQVFHAMSGQEGLTLLSNRDHEIQLVLLDWEMPDQTGPEVLQQIRELGHGVKVIMVTSKNEPDDIRMMIESGATEYVMKPFTPEILLEKIQSVMGVG